MLSLQVFETLKLNFPFTKKYFLDAIASLDFKYESQ